ncbi:hypothetical protein GmHk_16G046672 [Glycine max]|nr:hypothetical protein GmHk_16G046672 [Glycine max]
MAQSSMNVEFSNVGTKITNFECVVLPFDNNNEAMPLEATVNTISPFEHNAKANVFHIKA